jgi:hypothetical protein
MPQVYHQKNNSGPSLAYHALLDADAEVKGRKEILITKNVLSTVARRVSMLRFFTAVFGGMFVVTLILAGIWPNSRFKPRVMFTPESQ